MPTEAEEEDQLAKATKAAEVLYELRDTYFTSNPNGKLAKLRCQYDLVHALLDSIPLEQREVPAQRAIYEYVRGKMLDVVPYYCKEAEDHLSKAVKLNPSLVDAWLCVGDCIWKRGDLSAAKDCFIVGLKKGPNKKVFCRLSSLTREMAQGAENKAELIQESIQLAKKAITLDVKCGNSWYNLGNAYLTSFFATGSADRDNLMQCFKAYQNAEKDARLKFNPELSFSSAIAHKYLENFESALSRFEAAGLWYSNHNVSEMLQDTVNVLDKLDSALKEYTRAKKLGSVASDLASVKLSFAPYRRVTINTLSEGPNKRAAVLAEMLSFIKHDIIPPVCYLICDSETECFALSVYRLQYNAEYKFNLIRLDYINQALVNGKKMFQPQGVSTARSLSCSSACTSMHHKP